MTFLKKYSLLTTATSFPNFDGSFFQGNFIKSQLNGVHESFSEVTVIVPVARKWGILDRDKTRFNYSYRNVRVFFPKPFFIPRGGLKSIALDKFQHGVQNAIKKNRVEFDLIHAHFGLMGRSCINISQEHRKPLITSFYGYDAYLNTYDSQYYESLFKETTLILTLSDHMSKQLEKLGCQPHKIRKLHLGVDLGYFQPKERHVNIVDDKYIKILLVALFTEKKGILNAIKAFANVQKEIKNIHLDIVGRGPLKNQIESLIISLNLQNHIKITDNFSARDPRKTLLKFMQNCNIFILPSMTASNGDSEGTPVVLMEASACGKPCITTFHSGNPEVVLNKKTGLVVPERDIEGLERALKDLITNEDLQKQYGINARNHILNEFNSTIQAKKLRQIYKEVLGYS